MSVAVYAIHHVPKPNLADGTTYVHPIQGGAALLGKRRDIPKGFLRDDTGPEGPEYSARNRTWCDVTAHRWVWRNAVEDRVGVCHYRRFLSPYRLSELIERWPDIKPSNEVYLPPERVREVLASDPSGERLDRMLDAVNFVLPIPRVRPAGQTIMTEYVGMHRGVDWRAMAQALYAVYPDEAESALDYLRVSRVYNHHHIYAAQRRSVSAWYEWLMPVLHETERRVQPPTDQYQARSIGFLAERLWCWWLHFRPLSHIYVPVLIPEGE